uniref:Uncharacterized protein n=1 Tax=Chromera velia CCMP2878 TaxID=1169474 RepID=A0A0G4FPH2_9ALVE|eukprot:Cvel_17992.t1-p1 / transcript=Cvel_17992.t1 / gene=Cvel_17992 / organism=Chromera_velia_CCMP2878 / gene_product=hypothetical protein / transcript_product=hypothetical protein / location=Cvel_scaffold1466:25377-29239(+) / protein_length=787 / sequence_SO=supercontig / SO=protein_coding / is_pseudo=false
MSQTKDSFQNSPPAEEDLGKTGPASLQTTDNVLCSLIEHARPTAEDISDLVSDRKGFGLALILLGFIRTGRSLLHLASLDLSGFSLSARKLKLLLTSFPSGPGVLETLRCGPHVLKDACLPVLLDFLLRLKAGGTGGVPLICLKTLDLAKCDLGERMNPIFPLLPPSLEHLDLSGNRLRSMSMEGLGSAFSFGWLPSLLSLDVSDNPLGPSGLKAFARGLSSSPQSLPLQSLKFARTKAKAEGVEALAEALKAKKTTSLQTLDLEGNEMRALGLKHLVSAVNAETVPHLRVLILACNFLAHADGAQMDYDPIAELLSTDSLKELEELDWNGNRVFDRDIGGEGTGSQLSAAAFAVPGRFPKLRRLNLGGRHPAVINSEQLTAFATALGVGGGPSLQELVIPFGGSEENPEGIAALANACSSGHLSELRGLGIADRDDMTGEAFAGLCRSFATGKVSLLQTLDLALFYDDTGEGVGALAEGIWGRKLSLLLSFRLELSDVNGLAMSGLGLALGGGGCPSLHKLDLRWWEEGDEGVGGLAEGLGGGRLPSLRDLSLEVTCRRREGEGEWVGEGCIALGEVLSTGRVPSLRTVRLAWPCDQTFRSLCEGLSRGRVDPPVMVDIRFRSFLYVNTDCGLNKFAEVIRAGKLSGLRQVTFRAYGATVSREGGEAFGEALSHAESCMNSLEEMTMDLQTTEATSALLVGLSRGPGSLPALHTLKCPNGITSTTEAAQSLSTLMSGGKVPSLSDLRVSFPGAGQMGIQPFSAALSSPHVSALRCGGRDVLSCARL